MTGGVAAQLAGTGLLADDLYLMAHNDSTGRPYLQPRATGIGLAGALLAELLLAGGAGISSDGTVTAGCAPPAGQLMAQIQGQISRRARVAPGRGVAAVPGPHRRR